AGGGSNQPVELAARLSRDRGRVVDIGKCRLDLPWNAYYEKELDVRFSRSYGPGRRDRGSTPGCGAPSSAHSRSGSPAPPVRTPGRSARGRVVDIGKCRLDLPWNAYYEKELDVRFSRSYGPGRYDPEYELEGRDYPTGY
ncbi:hypothetical protein KDA82_34695, partial [Streptomyces daliensis]|nr:hypothetical protein [Streptomyces daliensis]